MLKSEFEPDVTALLRKMGEGDQTAKDLLFTIVYRELRSLARYAMLRERNDHTLQPTALVNEAFIRLAGQEALAWKDRKHFFAVASQTMRHILVDHARAFGAQKRAGGVKVELPSDFALTTENADVILAINEALIHLEQLSSRQCRVVELKYFAGLNEDETASILGVTSRTVRRDWQIARAWLHSRLAE